MSERRTLAEVEARIHALVREPDWDGTGAAAIRPSACDAAIDFLRRLWEIAPDLPLPFPAASTFGAVSLRWMRGAEDLAIHWHNDGSARLYAQRPDGRYGRSSIHFPAAIARVIAFAAQEREA